MKKKASLMLFLLINAAASIAQKKDTIVITPQLINTNVLKEGVHRYLVYFKMNRNATRTQTQFWTRKIEKSSVDGKGVITITQEWEDKDSIVHTVKSICDEKTLQPRSHEFWWKQRGTAAIDFENRSIVYNGSAITETDTAKQRKMILNAYKSVQDQFFLNWHLDLEVFPTLPYKKGVTFIIPFYDPGTSSPLQQVAYTVTGSAQLPGYDNQVVDCWLMTHEKDGNKEIFWISKKTREVLKLEQEVNGRLYRYKIKLGFSI
ncbi:MAG: hypothetical protein JNK08_03995 [Sediminibacterium sp.]|nr:hypothetical protein [Sediminibacterium sp.]